MPSIVAVASIHGTRTCAPITSDDGHHLSARAICVVQVVSTAENRTERLHILLTASSNFHHHTCMYVPYPAIVDVCRLSKEINAVPE